MKKITVHQEKTYKELGDLFGLFFEDINIVFYITFIMYFKNYLRL